MHIPSKKSVSFVAVALAASDDEVVGC